MSKIFQLHIKRLNFTATFVFQLANLDYRDRDLKDTIKSEEEREGKIERGKSVDPIIEYCWQTTSGCNGIVLELCDGSSSQRFDVSRNGIRSNSCGQVNFDG